MTLHALQVCRGDALLSAAQHVSYFACFDGLPLVNRTDKL